MHASKVVIFLQICYTEIENRQFGREEICLKEAVLLFLILQVSWQSEGFQNREQQIVVKLTQNSRAEDVFENISESGISPPELMRAQAE